MKEKNRSSFSGKLGFVLSAAGASVGLGNIWRFPYLAAKYGGGIFLLIYIVLALTFGYTMIMAETALGRMTHKSPVSAYGTLCQARQERTAFSALAAGSTPLSRCLIVPYYSVIGGWVIKYLFEYLRGNAQGLAQDGYFSAFIADGASAEVCFLLFAFFTLGIIFAGVRNGVERVSRLMMPVLVVLSVIIAVYSVTRPGALAGVAYFLVPNPANFSWMTVVTAMGQMFYSLSIAMGILGHVRLLHEEGCLDRGIHRTRRDFRHAHRHHGGPDDHSGGVCFLRRRPRHACRPVPALMFITIPKVFASMGLGTVVGVLFFVLVLFAAVTSSIALTESAVSTFEDELGWGRKKATVLVGVIMVALGTLSSLGYGPLAGVTVIGMQFLDFFDFLTNSVMMPIAAIATCLLVSRVIGVDKIEQEVETGRPALPPQEDFPPS